MLVDLSSPLDYWAKFEVDLYMYFRLVLFFFFDPLFFYLALVLGCVDGIVQRTDPTVRHTYFFERSVNPWKALQGRSPRIKRTSKPDRALKYLSIRFLFTALPLPSLSGPSGLRSSTGSSWSSGLNGERPIDR